MSNLFFYNCPPCVRLESVRKLIFKRNFWPSIPKFLVFFLHMCDMAAKQSKLLASEKVQKLSSLWILVPNIGYYKISPTEIHTAQSLHWNAPFSNTAYHAQWQTLHCDWEIPNNIWDIIRPFQMETAANGLNKTPKDRQFLRTNYETLQLPYPRQFLLSQKNQQTDSTWQHCELLQEKKIERTSARRLFCRCGNCSIFEKLQQNSTLVSKGKTT